VNQGGRAERGEARLESPGMTFISETGLRWRTRRPRPVSLGSRAVPRRANSHVFRCNYRTVPPADTFYVVMPADTRLETGAEGALASWRPKGARFAYMPDLSVAAEARYSGDRVFRSS